MNRALPRVRQAVAAALAVVLLASLTPGATASAKSAQSVPQNKAKNVIVLISDGMGYNHLAATNLYTDGKFVAQAYEKFPISTGMSTFAHPSVGGGYDPVQAWSSFDYVKNNAVDSAAAATAMSTGIKTYNAGIGVDVNGNRIKHVLERAEELGKSTGVVSSVQISHATPAGFVAHNASRNDYVGIANEMLKHSAVDVIMGAGHPYFDDNAVPRTPSTSNFNFVGGKATWDGLKAGLIGADADGDGVLDPFTLIESAEQFEQLTVGSTPKRVVGIAKAASTLQQNRGGDKLAKAFTVPANTSVPTLETMTKGALNVLDNDKDGLFLMVEGGAVDWAGHANQPGRTIEEQEDFNATVEAVIDWVNTKSNWNETLVIVTGDHETGYLTGPGSGQTVAGPIWNPIASAGIGIMPGMQFNSGDHTNSLIPLFAKGAGSGEFRAAATGFDPVRGAYCDNTDIAKAIFTRLK